MNVFTEEHRRRFNQLVQSDRDFELDQIRALGWCVIPVEHPFDPRDAEWISEAALERGYQAAFAVTVDENRCIVKTESIEISPRNVESLTLSINGLGRSVFLVPDDLGFAVLFRVDWYNLIAGPKQFVRRAVGSSFSTARRMFLQSEDVGTRERLNIERTLDRYAPFAEE